MGHQLKMAKLTYACVLTQQIDRLTSFYQDALDLALPGLDFWRANIGLALRW